MERHQSFQSEKDLLAKEAELISCGFRKIDDLFADLHPFEYQKIILSRVDVPADRTEKKYILNWWED